MLIWAKNWYSSNTQYQISFYVKTKTSDLPINLWNMNRLGNCPHFRNISFSVIYNNLHFNSYNRLIKLNYTLDHYKILQSEGNEKLSEAFTPGMISKFQGLVHGKIRPILHVAVHQNDWNYFTPCVSHHSCDCTTISDVTVYKFSMFTDISRYLPSSGANYRTLIRYCNIPPSLGCDTQ